MHDKVLVVDVLSFWLSFKNSFQGIKSIVMQTFFRNKSEEEWRQKSLRGGGGAPTVDESQAPEISKT